MTKQELLAILQRAAEDLRTEEAHLDADNALLAYINDPEIAAAYAEVAKWYA